MVQWMISAILLLALSENAHAHFVWLERDGDGSARAYFGEWIDDIREKTGGSGDEKFNRTRHISSLSFVAQQGIRWTDKP